MNYKCILYHGSHRETWTGELILLGMGDGWYEAEINGRGTYFHALTLGAQMEKKVIDTDVILASVSSQNLG